jgi:hypothetical protein
MNAFHMVIDFSGFTEIATKKPFYQNMGYIKNTTPP